MSENSDPNSKIIFDGSKLKLTNAGVTVTNHDSDVMSALLKSAGGQSFNSLDTALQTVEKMLGRRKK